MMINLNIKKIFSKGDLKAQVVTQIVNFGLIPFIAFGIGMLFFKELPYYALGLLLMGLIPTSGMTISWTGFAKGNISAAIKMTVIGLILGAVLTPLYAKLLFGRVIDIPIWSIFQQIFIVVFLTMALGYATQRVLVRIYGEAKYNKDIKIRFPSLSSIGVLGIIFVAMALKANTIVKNPVIILYILVPVLVFYGINYLITTLTGKYLLDRDDGIAHVYGTVMRNLSIALAIAVTAFGKEGSDIALIIAISYVVQVQSAAWYVKLSERIFGAKTEDKASDIMEEGIFSLHSDAPIQEAAKLMSEEGIHCVAVLNEKNIPLGLISSEMIVDLIAEEVDMQKTKLEEVKLKPVIMVKEKIPLDKVIKKMKKDKTYKVILTDEKGNLKGVLTETDIIRRFSQ